MTKDVDLLDALEKLALALQAIGKRMEEFEECFKGLIAVNQSMNRDQIKQQAAIIKTHNMLCDLVAPKND